VGSHSPRLRKLLLSLLDAHGMATVEWS
jgi:hypothetical protein